MKDLETRRSGSTGNGMDMELSSLHHRKVPQGLEVRYLIDPGEPEVTNTRQFQIIIKMQNVV